MQDYNNATTDNIHLTTNKLRLIVAAKNTTLDSICDVVGKC